MQIGNKGKEVSRNVFQGAAVSSLLVLVSLYLPIFGFLAALFVPLALLAFRIQLGRQGGLMVAGLTGLLVVLLLGKNPLSSLFFIELLVLGFVMGELLESGYSLESLVVGATVVVAGSAWLLLIAISLPSGSGVKQYLLIHIIRSLELTLEVYESLGIAPEAVLHLERSLDTVGRTLLAILPGLVLAGTLLVTWLNFLCARGYLTSRGMVFPVFGPLRHWQAPDVLVWGVILCGIMVWLLDYPLNVPGVNGLLVLLTIYFFQGIAIVSFYFYKKHFPRFARIFLYSLIALQQIFLLLVIALGFFDLWLDFRKLKATEDSETG